MKIILACGCKKVFADNHIFSKLWMKEVSYTHCATCLDEKVKSDVMARIKRLNIDITSKAAIKRAQHIS